jgi:hypothetical protein
MLSLNKQSDQELLLKSERELLMHSLTLKPRITLTVHLLHQQVNKISCLGILEAAQAYTIRLHFKTLAAGLLEVRLTLCKDSIQRIC